MQIFHHKEKIPDLNFSLNLTYFPEDALFIDIETTGFSAARSCVYLIGLAYRKADELITKQLFSASSEEELPVLRAFLEALTGYHTLITFNGIGFDFPFLKKRLEHHSLSLVDYNYDYVDLYQVASSLKRLLVLENYKQKTLERFLSVSREDPYTGGELISVYHEYCKHPKDEELRLLLQHNKEDLTGMIQLLPVLSYTSLTKGTYQIVSVKQQEYLSHKQEERAEVLFELLLPEPLPAAISCNNGLYFLSARNTTAYLRIPVETGTLKYFFPDYKNYYYLPAEDMAVHKSVAAYVDKQHRQPAKPATCYTKKQGLFLPQKKPLHTPVFFKEYKDTLSYFELTNELLADSNFLSAYSMECIASITLP